MESPQEPAEEFKPRTRSKFYPVPWESWLRMFVSFVCGALTLSLFVGGKTRDIAELLRWQGEIQLWRDKVENEGTRWARFNTDQQKAINDNQSVRISTLEQHEEQHAVMRQKIDRMEEDIKDFRKLHPEPLK